MQSPGTEETSFSEFLAIFEARFEGGWRPRHLHMEKPLKKQTETGVVKPFSTVTYTLAQ
jgi:hypothetical protein